MHPILISTGVFMAVTSLVLLWAAENSLTDRKDNLPFLYAIAIGGGMALISLGVTL